MNNQDSEGVQEYHHVLAGVECHDGSAMVAGLAMVDDGSVGADITTDIMVTDVAAEVITSEEVLSSKTLVISTDGKLSTAKEADSDGDNLQVNEEAKALEEHIAFIQHHHMEQQQHQNSQQLRLQQIVSAQPQSRAPQSPQQILVTTSSNNHHAQSQGIPIRPNISDIVSSPTTYSNLTSNLNGTLSSSNLPFNILTNTSTVTTTVEQPNNGPCMCFVCGRQLSDPSEKFYYLKTQKLFNTQITLLELLSDVLNQTVITNTGAVDLCARCSELINETDSAYTHLNRLKKQISNLFTSNQRPKLTFQVLPKTSNLGTIGVSSVPLVHQPPKLNLDDLAATRPRRGRQPRNIEAMKKKKKEAELITNKDCVQVKKKGGRPRKPYACHICKRKFHTKDMVASHMIKEHDIHPAGLVRPILRETDSPEPMSDSKEEVKSIPNGNKDPHQVKQEYEDSKEKLILKQCAMQNGIFANQTNPSLSLSTSGVCHTIVSSLSPASSKVGLDATSQVLASLRPIQPKPQTMIQTAPDGSMVLLMHPTVIDSSPTVIKVTPGYMNLKPGPYACDKCKKTFLDEKSRRMHRIAAHGYRKRKRDEEEDEDLVDKSEGHDNLWDCRLCQLSFSSRKTLTDHWKSVHPRCGENVVMNEGKQRVYACEECDMIFHYKYELERHRESHVPYTQMGPHEFVCCVCGLKVASKAALKIHLHRFHSKDEETKDYLCSECGYMASTKKAFTDHQRIHSDEPGPKARCAICEKEMLASSYKIHMLRMHGEAKHPCETCGQRFTVRSDLMRHLNTAHSTLKPYDCDLCGEKFVTSDALRYHRNKVHSTVTHYCEFCDKRYKWKGELRTHVQRNHVEHKERFQCSLCSRNYADRRKLRLHMTTKHNVPKEVTGHFLKNNYQRERAVLPMPYKGAEDHIPNSGYEPQGNLLPPPPMPQPTPHSSSHHIHQPMETIQTQAPVVSSVIYTHQQMPNESVVISAHHGQQQQQQQQHLHHLQLPSHHQHHTQTHQQHSHLSPVYIVPDLIPLHEEQVSTT